VTAVVHPSRNRTPARSTSDIPFHVVARFLRAVSGVGGLDDALLALVARAHGDDTAYLDHRDRYRKMAKTVGFEGHIEWAAAMP
jgi:hypothetical protein